MNTFLGKVKPGYVIYRSIKKERPSGMLNVILCSVFSHVGIIVEVKERSLRGIQVYHYSTKDDSYCLMI